MDLALRTCHEGSQAFKSHAQINPDSVVNHDVQD